MIDLLPDTTVILKLVLTSYILQFFTWILQNSKQTVPKHCW